MATAAVAVVEHGRPVYTCEVCNCRQFVPVHKRCRRCGTPMPVFKLPATPPSSDGRPKPNYDVPTVIRSIGHRIALYRAAASLSQSDLAGRMSSPGSMMSHAWVSRNECGHKRPSMRMLERYAEALGVEVKDFFKEFSGDWLFEEAKELVRDIPADKLKGITRFMELLAHAPEEAKFFAKKFGIMKYNG